jgi:hypothetical protein
VVLSDHVDDVGHVESGAEQCRPATRGSVAEVDQRMLVHPQAFLDIALGESGLWLARLTGAALQMLQRAG